MKPIRLEIAGLQSFVQKQVIDFSVVENGIFGIFGKTGSGKSTILDGITLSLYGYITRISKNVEFINSKSEKCEVLLQFVCDDKTYEVRRSFKLRKNKKDVESSAELYVLENNEWKAIAEGPFQTDKKIVEIVGLTANEFCQVIALPQGKFAEFLQASPAERTSLISSIFGITEYAERLYNKTKEKMAELEMQLTSLESEKEGVGSVSEQEIESKQLNFENSEKEIVELTAKINGLNKEYLTLVETASLKKDQIKLKEELESLYKQSNTIKQEKEQLFMHEKAKELEIYIDTKEKLINQLKDLNAEVTNLRTAKQEQEMFYRDYEEQFKKFEAIQKNAMLELDSKKIKYLELQEDKVLIDSLNIEKQRLQNELEEKTNTYLTIENKIKEIDSLLESIDKTILELKTQKESLENEKSKLEVVSENKSIESEIILIEQLESQVEKLIDNYKLELEEYKENYTTAYKKEREQLKRIEDISASLDKILGKSDKNLIQRFKDVNGKLYGMDAIQDKYDFLNVLNDKTKNETIKLLEQVKKLEIEADGLLATLQEKSAKVNKLESELKNAQVKREEFLGENVLSLLVQNVDIGAHCPVCKNRVAVKNNIPSTDLSGIDSEINNLRSALSVAYREKEKVACSLATITAQIQFVKNQISINKEKFQSVKNAQEKLYMSFVDKNDKQADNFKSMHEATYSASIALEKLLIEKDKILNSSLETIEERVEYGAKIQSTNEAIERLTDYLYLLQKNRAEREFAIYNIQNESGVDYKTARNQLIGVVEKIEELSVDIQNKENEKSALIASKLEEIQTLGLVAAEKNALTIKLDNVVKNIDEKKERFNSIGVDFTEENVLEEIENRQKELESKAREFENNYNDKLEQKQKSEKEYSLKQAMLCEKNEDLRELEAKLSNLASVNGFKDVKDVESSLMDAGEYNLLKDKVEEFEKRVSVVNIQLTNINEKIGDDFIDIERVDNIKTELDELNSKLGEKQVYFGVLQAELGELKTKKAKLAKIDERLPEIKKEYDLAKELHTLLRGKTLPEFMANEYVDMIVGFANEKLRILDGGRYRLYYENKDFYVEDNLNDGSSRLVNTLSGGETFLVSLSLALAISDVIAMQSDKKIEFFFLDEGFGTLDNELCKTVVRSLLKLKSVNLNIGIISHVQELQLLMQYKFMVTKANENSGSKVQLVTSL